MVYLQWKMPVFKFLDVIVKPDNCKLKVIPFVAEYMSTLRDRMYKLIF